MKIEQFLLARIAEDEAEVQEYLDYAGENCPAYEGRTDLTDVEKLRCREDEEDVSWWGEYGHMSYSPARLLIECTIRRRITQAYIDFNGRHIDLNGSERLAARITLRNILGLFALPYHRHPDFDPTWRQV